jgi:hypothetical protein
MIGNLLVVFAVPPIAAQNQQALNDYPTVARADYVFGCMKVNGETQEAMQKCSCSIDVIASLLPYEKYDAAASFMSVGQLQGEKGVLFRQTEPAKQAINELQRARAEAEIRCF